MLSSKRKRSKYSHLLNEAQAPPTKKSFRASGSPSCLSPKYLEDREVPFRSERARIIFVIRVYDHETSPP